MLRIALALCLVALTHITSETFAGGGSALADGLDEQPEKKIDGPKADVDPSAVKTVNRPWKEIAVLETPGWLPGSVAYSSDGKLLVVGGTGGKVMAFDAATRNKKWEADVGGNFASLAFTSDGLSIVATCKDGIRFLDAATGDLGKTIEEKESRPLAVGVFPDQTVIADGGQVVTTHKIIFGDARGYFVKIWISAGIETGAVSTIETKIVAKDNTPTDPNAVPLAVDPAGRSAIVTGPIDPATGKNVLWAWVAGNYDEGSPGNRLLAGHQAAVVSAAWSKDGKIAATGDTNGRVILWNGKTMKETRRFELGKRVAALALSNSGESVAAVAVGKRAEYFAWEGAQARSKLQPIHVDDASDFSGPIHACLAFSPDGRQLMGSAINTAWLTRLGELVGKVHVWQTEKSNPETKK